MQAPLTGSSGEMTVSTTKPDAAKRTGVVAARRVWICALPALLVAAACLIPFLNKPYIMDDPEFLKMARQILVHPLHPTDFTLCWNVPPLCLKTYELAPGNTLLGYALTPTILAGGAEWMAHLTQLIFVCIAILAMSSFVMRMGWSPGHATIGALLLVAVPPCLPMASTAMPDVLALALGLVGIERLAAWKAERRWSQGVAAAFGLGLAGMARAHLVLLIPLGAFFLLDSLHPNLVQIKRSYRLWGPVVAAAALLLVMILSTRERGLLLNPPARVSGIDNIRFNLPYFLMFFCFPFPLAATWAAAQWAVRRWRLVGVVLAASVVGFSVRSKIWILALVSAGALSDVAWQAWKKLDHEAAFLWLWLMAPLPIVYYSHFPIKYLLPCVPALIILCFRLARDVPARVVRAGSVLWVIAGLAYSLVILRSDADFAWAGRDAMVQLVQPHVARGERVWYGGEFSAYWYAGTAGARLVVPGSSEPARGDLLAIGIREDGETLKRYPNRTLVQSIRHHYRFGRTMWRGAGLYSNRAGPWLLAFGDDDDDRYELWRID